MGTLSTTAIANPAVFTRSWRCASDDIGHASPIGTSCSAVTMPVTLGICRIDTSGIGSVAPNQRKVICTGDSLPSVALRSPARAPAPSRSRLRHAIQLVRLFGQLIGERAGHRARIVEVDDVPRHQTPE